MDDNVIFEYETILNALTDAGVNPKRIDVLKPVIENVAWIKCKLDDAREAVKNSNVVIAYDNGGGQKGIRENPLFKGYEALWKSYLSGMDKILSAMPQEKAQEVVEKDIQPQLSVLEIVQRKRQQGKKS